MGNKGSSSNDESKSNSTSDKISKSSNIVQGVNSEYQTKVSEAKQSKEAEISKNTKRRESLKSQYREGKITLNQERSGIMKANNNVMKFTNKYNTVSSFDGASKTFSRVTIGIDFAIRGY